MKNILFLLIVFTGVKICTAQVDLQCNGRDRNSIYVFSAYTDSLYRIDSVDTNPSGLITVAPIQMLGTAYGISINPNFDSIAGPVTMYAVQQNGYYHYWNGSGWTATGNFTGHFNAVNPGGSKDFIFNCTSSNVYRYDGTGPGTLLLSPTFSMFLDIATDSLGNFYIYHPNSRIVAYTPAGVPIDTFYTKGSLGSTGGGFALLGNRFYASGIFDIHEGILIGDTVHFSVIYSNTTVMFTDLATCPVSGSPVAVFEIPDLPHFVISPNPAVEIANIQLHNTILLDVYDCLGKKCKSISVKGLFEYPLELSDLETGIYFIKATSKNNLSSTQKLVVR